MKRFLIPPVFLILAACAQAPSPGDGVQPDLAPLVFGGPGEEGVVSLAKHSAGVYTVGFSTNKAQPNPEGETDVFIRKYSSSRSVIWTRKFGTLDDEFVEGADSDGSDNVYVVGSVFTDVGEEVFVRKYRADGQLAWTRQFGSSLPEPGPDDPPLFSFNSANGVATYGSNAIYVVGRADGKLTGSVGDGDLFVRKYTASGSVTWTRKFGFTEGEFGFDYVSDVAVDGGGNAYVVGSTDRTLGGGDNDGSDMFIRKYSPSGSVVWTRQRSFGDNDFAESVAISGSNVYVGVSYVSDVTDLGTESGIRIVKFSTGGVQAQGWSFVYASADSVEIEDLNTDKDGNVYFSGANVPYATRTGDSDGIVVKLKPSGVRAWSKRVVSSGNESANAVLARTPTEVYVGGLTDGVLGPANRGNLDPYLRRLRGGDGSTVWTEQ